MRKPSLILIGAGGHALSCIDVVEQEDKFEIAGLVGAREEIGNTLNGYKVIASDLELSELRKDYEYALVAIGQFKNANLRSRLFYSAFDFGFIMPTIISPYSYVSTNSKIGSGTIIMHGSIINSGVHIGQNCIINSKSLIEHGAMIHDHTHVSTGSIINGDVQIGEWSFVGSGAVVKQGIKLGRKTFIQMGQSVISDQPPIRKKEVK